MLIALIVLSVINLFILVSLCVFVVQFRQKTHERFVDLINLLENLFETVPNYESKEDRQKTWDEKYEEELDAYHRKLREISDA